MPPKVVILGPWGRAQVWRTTSVGELARVHSGSSSENSPERYPRPHNAEVYRVGAEHRSHPDKSGYYWTRSPHSTQRLMRFGPTRRRKFHLWRLMMVQVIHTTILTLMNILCITMVISMPLDTKGSSLPWSRGLASGLPPYQPIPSVYGGIFVTSFMIGLAVIDEE